MASTDIAWDCCLDIRWLDCYLILERDAGVIDMLAFIYIFSASRLPISNVCRIDQVKIERGLQ